MGSGNTKNSKQANNINDTNQNSEFNKQDQLNSSQNSILGDNLEADMHLQYDYQSQLDPIVSHSLNFRDVNLTSVIEIYISCENLQNMDIMSFSDPYVKVQIEEDGDWIDLGQTEIIPDNLDPKFATSFNIKFNIDDPPRLKFDVYDVDECINIKKAEQTEHMGEAICKLEELLNDQNQQLKIPLQTKKGQQKKNEKINQPTRFVKIKGYFHDNYNYQYFFKMQLEGFKSKHEIYIKLNKQVKNKYYPLYMTECVKNNQKGLLLFQQFLIQDAKILDSNVLQFQVFEFMKTSTKLKLLGEQNIEMDVLKQSFLQNNTENIKFYKGKSLLGTIQIIQFKKYMYNYDFLKYIYGGCNLKIMLALDFSNPYCYKEGEKYQDSAPELIEENENVIRIAQETIKIFSHLDGTSKIVTYGFGSKMPPYKNFHSNCFALSSDFFDPELDSVDKIKERYDINLQTMSFSQLSIYSEVINQARKLTEKQEFSNKEQTYTVLILITKGNLYSPDLQQCLDEIVLASYQPMSIINVSVQDGNYSYVQMLEPDKQQGYPLYSPNLDLEAERNIFNFVDYKNYQFQTNYNMYEDVMYKKEFANGLFRLLPENLLKYARKRNIHPVRLNISEKEATQGYFERKIQLMKQPSRIDWLQEEQKALYDELVYNQQHPAWIIRKILEQGLPCLDVNYILERISYEKNYQGIHRYNNESFLQHQLNIMDKNKLKQRVLKIHNKKSNNQQLIFKKNDDKNINQYSKQILNSGKDIKSQQNQLKNKNKEDEQLAYNFQKKLMFEYKDINQQILENDQVNPFKAKSLKICVLCCKNNIDITLMPCGHAYCCLKCYNENTNRKRCPSCNHVVSHIVDIQNSNVAKIISHFNSKEMKKKSGKKGNQKDYNKQQQYQLQKQQEEQKQIQKEVNDFLYNTPDVKSDDNLSDFIENNDDHSQINKQINSSIESNKNKSNLMNINNSSSMVQKSPLLNSVRGNLNNNSNSNQKKSNKKQRLQSDEIQINVIDHKNWTQLLEKQ